MTHQPQDDVDDLSTKNPFYLSIYLSIYYLSSFLSIYLSIYSFIHLSFHRLINLVVSAKDPITASQIEASKELLQSWIVLLVSRRQKNDDDPIDAIVLCIRHQPVGILPFAGLLVISTADDRNAYLFNQSFHKSACL